MSHHRFTTLELKVSPSNFLQDKVVLADDMKASNEIKITKLALFSFIAFPLDKIPNNWKTFFPNIFQLAIDRDDCFIFISLSWRLQFHVRREMTAINKDARLEGREALRSYHGTVELTFVERFIINW